MRFFFRCLEYFRSDAPQILWSLLLIFLATVAGLLSPFPMAILIDQVGYEKPATTLPARLFASHAPADKLHQILWLAGIQLALVIIGALLTMAQTMASVKVGYRGLTRVRSDLFHKLQQLSLGYHRAQSQGDVIYRLAYDTFGFQTILKVFVGNILVSSVMLVVMTWIMFSMNWRLALISVTIVPLLVFTHRWSQKRLVDRWVSAKEEEAGLTTLIHRSIASIWLTQAFGREADESKRFRGSVDSTVNSMLRVHRQEVSYGLAVAIVLGIGSSLILGYGGYMAVKGIGGMTIGGLYIFISYLAQFYAPLNNLTGSGATMASGAVGAKRVFEVLDTPPAITDAPDAVDLPRRSRTLELHGLTFEYRAGEPVLRELSATIEPGQMVAFVGSSGVGKSTLLNLLPRFYDPTGGAILLDGHDLRKIKVSALRKHIALVLQESTLLPASVAENIAYGRPDASADEVRNAAELAEAATFIDAMPGKYAEPINENSNNLSGGQKQRIAIARALLTEAPVMILDEPTSALDPQNEQMITTTLRRLKRQRTIILVSHRLSTVADCDQIFVMEAGRIIERGTHAELVAARGLYWRMARHQMKLDDGEEGTDSKNGDNAAAEPSAPAAK